LQVGTGHGWEGYVFHDVLFLEESVGGQGISTEVRAL
jgi:CubicO group peptidase (beta-lactamase class C family)